MKIRGYHVFGLILLIIGAIFVAGSVEYVGTGEVGVQRAWKGGVKQEVLSEGYHFKPFVKVTDYPVSMQTLQMRNTGGEDDRFLAPSKDGKQVEVAVELSYSYDVLSLPATFTAFSGASPNSIENSFMKGKIIAWTSEATSQYPVMDLYSDRRVEATKAAEDVMKERFAEHGIIVHSFLFTQVNPDENSLIAIQERVDASQRLETEKINKQRIKEQADQKSIQAQGEADALRIKAEGEAAANEILEKSLTPQVVQKMKLDNERHLIYKWDGGLPQIQSGGGTILNIDKLLDSKNK